MPTPTDSRLKDRIYEFVSGKSSRQERALLAAAKPPRWVRLAFGLIFSVLVAALLVAIFARWMPLSWAPRVWPAWSLVAVVLVVTQFAKREVYRQYGKRASRGQQDHI